MKCDLERKINNKGKTNSSFTMGRGYRLSEHINSTSPQHYPPPGEEDFKI